MATVAPSADGERARASPRFEALVLDFLAHLEFERGLSRNTLSAYRTDLLQLGGFLAERGRDATTATAEDLSDFLAALAPQGMATATDAPPARRATVNRKAACLRSFYRHLRREELVEDDPAGRAGDAAARPQAARGPELRRGPAPAGPAAAAASRPRFATGRCWS